VENLIGEENKGFSYIMQNFNHERFVLGAQANRFARVCIEEAIRYGRTRKTFGKRLVDHQAIRHKLAEMVSRVEATHALLEQIAFQLCQKGDENLVAGSIALAKVHTISLFLSRILIHSSESRFNPPKTWSTAREKLLRFLAAVLM